MLKRHFRKVTIHRQKTEVDGPVMLIGNHFSWWDGFIADYINDSVFGKKLFIMMLEEQLKPRMFLNKAGAFSVRKGSRSVVESINYASGILREKENLLVMYPQGEILSMHQWPVKFERGIQKILEKSPRNPRIFFYVALVDYFSNRKPSLDLYIHEYSAENTNSLEMDFNNFAQKSISCQREE